MTTWDILIPTIPHRDATLRKIFADLDRQWQPGLGVIVMRDNLERSGNASYAKWQELLEASSADYVSYVSDDDFFAPDFVARVMEALEQAPDYVGFPVLYTRDGVPQQRVEHSLRHGSWKSIPGNILARDIVHQNPLRREAALLVTWGTDLMEEDQRWADAMRGTGALVTEAWIDDPMYYYQASNGDNWTTARRPMNVQDIHPLPEYPWLTALGSC